MTFAMSRPSHIFYEKPHRIEPCGLWMADALDARPPSAILNHF